MVKKIKKNRTNGIRQKTNSTVKDGLRMWSYFSLCRITTSSISPTLNYNIDFEKIYLDASAKQNLTLQAALLDLEVGNYIEDWTLWNYLSISQLNHPLSADGIIS